MSSNAADRTTVHTRIFTAPRALVFAAWTQPEHIKHWWGPNGFTNTIHEFDFREGGDWKFTMHGPDGKNYKNHIQFVEIVKNEKIVLHHLATMHVFTITTTFEDHPQGTKLTWSMEFESAEEFNKSKPYVLPGNEQNLDRLGAYLPKMKS